MAEVLLAYDTVLRGRDGRAYSARACGRERADGTWEGWLEFVPEDGGPARVTGRESTQPDREALHYWATGLTDPYLDGALLRVQTEYRRPSAPGPAAAEPAAARSQPAASGPAAPRAVLDPFQVYDEGADILRSQLAALSADQLRNIVRQYGLSTAEPPVLDALSQAELAALIMTGVEARRSV